MRVSLGLYCLRVENTGTCLRLTAIDISRTKGLDLFQNYMWLQEIRTAPAHLAYLA